MGLIYNPTSGKRVDIKKVISDKLHENGIKHEYLVTQGPSDAFKIAYNLKLDMYSALISVGGDGTFHEMVNGLLLREDKKMIPVGLLPNGSGNDFGNCFKFKDIDTALEHLIKGTSIKIDAVKVLIDHEKEEDIKIEASSKSSVDLALEKTKF